MAVQEKRTAREQINTLLYDLRDLGTPLGDEAAAFLTYTDTVRELSENTVMAYGRNLRKLAHYAQKRGVTLTEDLTPQMVIDYLADLRAEGRASGTRAQTFSTIREFARFAILQGAPMDNLQRLILGMHGPKIRQATPPVLSPKQVLALFEALSPKDRYHYRDWAMLELLYATGIRVEELATVTPRDIDLFGNTIWITGKGGKRRKLPVTERAMNAVRDYITNHRMREVETHHAKTNRLFLTRTGRAISRIDVWRILSRYAERAGLPRLHPHALRHAFATHLLGRGGNLATIQHAMGHESIQSTQVYIHVDTDSIRRMVNRCHPLK